jgi:response regulator RpfG family c-di-GMP phosphodiesterase
MPDIILPPASQGSTLKTLLVVCQQRRSMMLANAIAQAIPAIVLLVHSSEEALEVTCDIKPDAFLLEDASPYIHAIELYDQLHASISLKALPAMIIGDTNELQHEAAARNLVHLRQPLTVDDLWGKLKPLLEDSERCATGDIRWHSQV